MAGSLKFFLITLDDECATTLGHLLSFAVAVGSVDFATASHHDVITTLLTAATVIPAGKQIVPAVALVDERSLDGVHTRPLRRGILQSRRRGLVATGNGLRLLAGSHMHRAIQADQLYAIPERAVDQPRGVVIIDGKAGIDGIPVVAQVLIGIGLRRVAGDDAAKVLPFGACQRRRTHQAYRRCVLAEGRAAVRQPPAAMPADDVGSPHMVLESRNSLMCPLGNLRHHTIGKEAPRLPIF